MVTFKRLIDIHTYTHTLMNFHEGYPKVYLAKVVKWANSIEGRSFSSSFHFFQELASRKISQVGTSFQLLAAFSFFCHCKEIRELINIASYSHFQNLTINVVCNPSVLWLFVWKSNGFCYLVCSTRCYLLNGDKSCEYQIDNPIAS